MNKAHRVSWVTGIAAGTMWVAGLASPAQAADTGGGFSTAQKPKIAQLTCSGGTATCRQGEALTVAGSALKQVTSVVFLGRGGRADDTVAAAQADSDRALTVTVPDSARSGRVRVVTDDFKVNGPKLKVRAADRSSPEAARSDDARTANTADGVYPIRGKHDLGQTATNDFGGPRDHKGQDMFAACGTPLVSAMAGTVTIAKYDSRGGNYAVVTDRGGRSQVYMHMRAPALVSKGQTVRAGQPIGEVGDSGAAEGCHLHFELWSAPGWYTGGKPIDPLPTLKAWDAKGHGK